MPDPTDQPRPPGVAATLQLVFDDGDRLSDVTARRTRNGWVVLSAWAGTNELALSGPPAALWQALEDMTRALNEADPQQEVR